MLDELGEAEAAVTVREAVNDVFASGARTADLWTEGKKRVSTREMGDLVLEQMARKHDGVPL